MVSPSTTLPIPIPANTGMDDTAPALPIAAQGPAIGTPSFTIRLNQARGPRPANAARRPDPASRHSPPTGDADDTQEQDAASTPKTETAQESASPHDAPASAVKSSSHAMPTAATQDVAASPALPAGLAGLPPIVPGHPNVTLQALSVLPAGPALPASGPPPIAAHSPAGIPDEQAHVLGAAPHASNALHGAPEALRPNTASRSTSLTSGTPMDSHASQQAPASGIGIATPPTTTDAIPAGPGAASQLMPGTPAPAKTAVTLPAAGTAQAAPAPVPAIQASTTPTITTAPAAPLHQAQTAAHLTIQAQPQAAGQTQSNAAERPVDTTARDASAGGQTTTVDAPGASAPTTAAQRLNGIDRLFTLQGTQTGRSAAALRPKASVPETGPQIPVGPSLPAARSTALPANATPQTPFREAQPPLLAPAAVRSAAQRPAAEPTRESAPLNPTAVTSRPAATPPAAKTAASADGPHPFKASAATNGDQATVADSATPDSGVGSSAVGPLATAQTAAQVPAAKGVVPDHDTVERIGVSEAARHPSSAQSAITTAAVTAAQSGAGAETNANGGQQRSTGAAPQPDASQAGTAGLAGTAQTLETVSGVASQSAAGSPLDNAQVIAQVTRHIETMRLLNGRGEITLQLQPDHLGSLRMTITSHADGITAHIVTESALAQHVMQNAGMQLHAALEARGLRLTSFDVSVGNAANAGAGSATPQDTPQDRTARGFSGNRSGGRSIAAVAEIDGANPDPGLVAGAGTINTSSRLDYRA